MYFLFSFDRSQDASLKRIGVISGHPLFGSRYSWNVNLFFVMFIGMIVLFLSIVFVFTIEYFDRLKNDSGDERSQKMENIIKMLRQDINRILPFRRQR